MYIIYNNLPTESYDYTYSPQSGFLDHNKQHIEKPEYGSIIYTHIVHLQILCNILKKLDGKFIVVLIMGDDTVLSNNNNVVTLINRTISLPDSIYRLYSKNVSINDDLVRCMPIGMLGGHPKYMDKINTDNKQERVYCNFKLWTHPGRQACLDTCKKLPFVDVGGNLSDEAYINVLAKYCFCLCPRGNGLDTYRFWESLYVKTIPIIIKNDVIPQFIDKVPVIVLKNWEQLQSTELKYDYWDSDIIKTSYWTKVLRDDQTCCRLN